MDRSLLTWTYPDVLRVIDGQCYHSVKDRLWTRTDRLALSPFSNLLVVKNTRTMRGKQMCAEARDAAVIKNDHANPHLSE